MNLASSWEQLQVAEENVETAQSSLKQLEDYYKAGLSPLSEVLKMQSQLQQCFDDYVNHSIAYKIALQEYLNCTNNSGV